MVVLVIRAEEEDATRKENLRLRPYKRQQQRSEKMRFYHAAPKETMMKIYAEGVLKKSWDGGRQRKASQGCRSSPEGVTSSAGKRKPFLFMPIWF